MKCPFCGKENPNIRLFCMSCGEILPEAEPQSEEKQDIETAVFSDPDPEFAPAHSQDSPAVESASENTLPVSDTDDTEFFRKRERSRRIIEEAWPENNNIPKSVSTKSIFDDFEPSAPSQSDSIYSKPPVSESRQRPSLERGVVAEHGSPSTIIPKRNEDLKPDDFFAVKGQVLPDYEYGEEEYEPANRKLRSEYEDEPKQSFFMRHMRSVVSLMLLLLTIAIVLVWANTDGAQRTLATLDIAWRPEAYAQLAAESYSAKDLSAAGYYYSQAAKRDPANYAYAISAANAYIEGGYTSKALDAVRNCITLTPADIDLYLVLLELQPDRANISAEDRELLHQGYRLTGDERLNIE